MRNIHRLALALVLLALAPGCKTPVGTGGGGLGAKIVDCATRAIRDRGLSYVGKVNDVIGNTGISDSEARNRLVNMGIDAGQDVLGCLLADQGKKFAESAAANPDDKVAKTAAKRAERRLEELQAEGWRFER